MGGVMLDTIEHSPLHKIILTLTTLGVGEDRMIAALLEMFDALSEREWAKDRALRLFLLLLDPQEPLDELRDYAECVEELIDQPEVLDFVRARMTSEPFPVLVEVNRIQDAARNCLRVLALFTELVDIQRVIKSEAKADDGGGRTQSCLCQKGRHPREGGKGVEQGRHEEEEG